MALVDTAVTTLHLLFAGVWTGAVVFVAWSVVPLAASGGLNADPLGAITDKLTLLSRASAVALLLTGGHLAVQGYSVESLTGSTRGYLVIAMVVLWLALMGLVEVAGSKLSDGTDDMKVREPAREAKPFLQGGTVVALLLLVNGGLLAGGL
jgi:predicted tellurium resistance membrane protein TerC